MKRLPSYDLQTDRGEKGLFLLLSAAAAALILMTAWNGAQFATPPEEALRTTPPEDVAQRQGNREAGPTNLTFYRSGTRAERARLDGSGAPKS